MLTFSIALAAPNIRMAEAIKITMQCQGTLPSGPVAAEKYAAASSVRICPLTEPHNERKIQPTMME